MVHVNRPSSRGLLDHDSPRNTGSCQWPGNLLIYPARFTVSLNELFPEQSAGTVTQQNEHPNVSFIMDQNRGSVDSTPIAS
jgi:hypothetical protein